jgi:hypothetical protein
VEKITSVGWQFHVGLKSKLRKPAMIGAVLTVLVAVAVCACVFLVAWWLIGKF